jgi:multimeric flavodoxin WrbA
MKVLVVYHTTYDHTLQLARAVEAGVKSVAGVELSSTARPFSSMRRLGVEAMITE